METPQKPFEKKRIVTIYGVVALLIVLALLLTLQPTGGAVFTAAKKAMVAERFNQIQTALLSYYTEYSVYPVASDAATLVRILTGATKDGNQRQIAFAAFKPSELDVKGDLLDPWGTSIELSVTADGKLHIRSAGPDKIFGTADDIRRDANLTGEK
jgi:type II secretory pathway pseudopilin PulG